MNIAIPILDRCTKLALMRAARTIDMTPTASRVLQFLIDEPGAAYWSLKRLAHAVRRQPRTVDFAIAELKRLGFITVFYRRRTTSVKVLLVDAVLTAVSRAVALAKAAARAAMALVRKKLQASHLSALNIHIGFNRSAETASWREQKPASAALLRSMGLPVPPGRR